MSDTDIRPGVVFIDVWDSQARVAQYRDADYGLTWSYAANWRDLEEAAWQAVEAQDGGPLTDGHFICPADLAARAVWADLE